MVSILITTYNSVAHLKACLESVLRQEFSDREIIVVDNASSDGTRAVLQEFETRARVIYNDTNRGFSGGQNQAISQARGDWMLSLNPDVLLSRGFLTKLVEAGESDARIGTVCGKLLRWGPGGELTNIIDSTGIYFLRNLRHLDRGNGQVDRGQYEAPEYVFGATGAAALYRRTMIDDITSGGEFFDEDFFAYREDADVASFPGETEDDFAATLSLVGEIGYSGAFSFKYSRRPGTPGADMDDQVEEAVKSDRLQRLQAAIDLSQATFNRDCVGRTFSVLFERPGRHSGQLVGRSPYLQPVQIEASPTLIGEIAPVTITDVASNSLFGALNSAPEPALAGAGA